MSRLIACAACHRHARASEKKCPFCGASMPKAPPVRGTPAGKFGRAALVVATTTGVAGAIDLSGCSDGHNIIAGDAYGIAADVTLDHVTAADAYGIAFDSGPDAKDADAAPDAADAAPDADDGGTDAAGD